MTIPTTAGRLRVKYVRQHVPTSRRQCFYLVEVLIGLGVTARHFFGNLGRWLSGKKGAVTYQWPEERRPLPSRLRSLHRLVHREDGSPRGVACLMCGAICPAHRIFLVARERPEPDRE